MLKSFLVEWVWEKRRGTVFNPYSQFEIDVKRSLFSSSRTLKEVQKKADKLIERLRKEILVCLLEGPNDSEQRIVWTLELLWQLLAEARTRQGLDGFRYHLRRLRR